MGVCSRILFYVPGPLKDAVPFSVSSGDRRGYKSQQTLRAGEEDSGVALKSSRRQKSRVRERERTLGDS